MPTHIPWMPPSAADEEISFDQAIEYATFIAHAEPPWCVTSFELMRDRTLITSMTGRLFFMPDFSRRADYAGDSPTFALSARAPVGGDLPSGPTGDSLYIKLHQQEVTRCTVWTEEYGDLWALAFHQGPFTLAFTDP